MRSGVEFSSPGDPKINVPEELKKYEPLYDEIVRQIIFLESSSCKYQDSGYNMYEDRIFLDGINRKLNEITDFLLENQVFPDDILEPRETKQVDIDVVFDKNTRNYYGHVFCNCGFVYIIPIHKELFFSTKQLHIKTWKLLKNTPTDIYLHLLDRLGKNRKRLSKKVIISGFNRPSYKELLHDFESNMLSVTFPQEVEDTGIKVTLSTEELSPLYSPLRYILETCY